MGGGRRKLGVRASFDVNTKHARKRSKTHLALVASQPCIICGATPCDAHHVKIARPHSLGRKVSDVFTVPLGRPHHQELHRYGNERTSPAHLKNGVWRPMLGATYYVSASALET